MGKHLSEIGDPCEASRREESKPSVQLHNCPIISVGHAAELSRDTATESRLLLFSTPPHGGQFGCSGLLFSAALLSDGPDTIIYQSLGAWDPPPSSPNLLPSPPPPHTHSLHPLATDCGASWKSGSAFGQDRKATNNQSVSREYSYFQAWINAPFR